MVAQQLERPTGQKDIVERVNVNKEMAYINPYANAIVFRTRPLRSTNSGQQAVDPALVCSIAKNPLVC